MQKSHVSMSQNGPESLSYLISVQYLPFFLKKVVIMEKYGGEVYNFCNLSHFVTAAAPTTKTMFASQGWWV